METLKEKVIKAILDDKYSEEELEYIYSKTFYEQKLLEAMTVISSIEVTEGFINDAYYSNIMEEIEERREAFKKQMKKPMPSKTSPYIDADSNKEKPSQDNTSSKKNKKLNSTQSIKKEESSKKNQQKSKKSRNNSEETIEKLRANAEKARAALAEQRKAKKENKN